MSAAWLMRVNKRMSIPGYFMFMNARDRCAIAMLAMRPACR
jgi:hypothetical protein